MCTFKSTKQEVIKRSFTMHITPKIKSEYYNIITTKYKTIQILQAAYHSATILPLSGLVGLEGMSINNS